MEARRRVLRARRHQLAQAAVVHAQTGGQATPAVTPLPADDLFLLVEGKIESVRSGDTVSVKTGDGKFYAVRMLGIRAPETGRDLGGRSRKTLSELILGKDVTVIIRKRVSAALYAGTVYHGGRDINLEQIETGMAWYFPQNPYAPTVDDRRLYEQAEQKARAERSGMWSRQKFTAAVGLHK